MSLSIAMMIKGAIVLSKSAAVKAALLKYGGYLITTKGLVATASAAATVTTYVGYFDTITSIPKNAKNGFSQIIIGMADGSPADVLDGIYKLSSVYSSTNSLLGDFDTFVNSGDLPFEKKDSLKKSLRGLYPLLENEIEQRSYNFLKEVENKLRECNLTSDEYSKAINKIYITHTCDLDNNYQKLLGRCGRIYSDISNLNQKHKIAISDKYDHYLVYCIAGWIIDNINLSCLYGVTQKQLAEDITNQIFAYLKAYNLS